MRALPVVATRMLVALMLVSPSSYAGPKAAGWAILRSTPAPMPARPTVAEVEELLINSQWVQPNPEKKTSTWEAYSYKFEKDGTVARSGDLVRNPPVLRWKVTRAGARPVISIGAARLTMEPCARRDKSQTLCLFGKAPRS